MSDQEGTDEQAYIRYLLSNLRCPVCRHRYDHDDILDFGHKDELWLVALSCSECETKGLVFAIIKSQPGLAESFTELTPEESARFKEREAITADDVLDLHEFLRDYRGDVAELLGDEA